MSWLKKKKKRSKNKIFNLQNVFDSPVIRQDRITTKTPRTQVSGDAIFPLAGLQDPWVVMISAGEIASVFTNCITPPPVVGNDRILKKQKLQFKITKHQKRNVLKEKRGQLIKKYFLR